MKEVRSDFVDALRSSGYAVSFDASSLPACETIELVDRAACFVESALAIAGRPMAGQAYIRLSGSQGVLFVEVTHLSRGTFDTVMRDAAAVQALDELRHWTMRSGRSLSVERGPNDQLRIAVTLEPDRAGECHRV